MNCKHSFPRYEQRAGFYYITCEKCGYKYQLRNIQKPDQAEEYRKQLNKENEAKE